MALKTFVKISGINNLSDARYCAGMGVDVLGFSFEPDNPDYIDPTKYTAITEWLSGVEFCAEFSQATAEQIQETLQQYPQVAYLQIRNADYLPVLQLLRIPIILRLDAALLEDSTALQEIMQKSAADVAYFFFEDDAELQNTDQIDMVLHLAEQYPLILGFGLDEKNVLAILENSHIKGIALRGGDEIKPGLKDFDDLADILETIEIDDLD